jgi:hypothetical protein
VNGDGGCWLRCRPRLVPTRVAVAPARAYQFFWWCRTSASRGRSSQGASTASTSTKYGQYIYVVAASDLVLVRLGWDVGYRHWPQLLSDLARRLNESASGKAS